MLVTTIVQLQQTELWLYDPHMRRFFTLDGLRGVAALAVLLGHAGDWITPLPMPKTWLAVDLFFILSGFVLSRVYEPRFAAGMTVRQFMTERCLRLYPLALLGAVFGIIFGGAALFMGKGDLPPLPFTISAITSLLILPSPTWNFDPQTMPLNPPAWSLFFELFVNLMFVAVWRFLDRRVLVAIVAFSAFSLIYCFFTSHGFGGSNWTGFGWGFPRVIFGFFMGVYVGRYARFERVETTWAWTIPFILGGVLFIYPPASPIIDLLMVLIGFPALVIAGSIFEPARVRFLGMLGIISYPMYAIHVPLLVLGNRIMLFVHLHAERYAPVTGAVFALVIAVIAYWLDSHYDLPARAWLKSKTRPHRKADAHAGAAVVPEKIV